MCTFHVTPTSILNCFDARNIELHLTERPMPALYGSEIKFNGPN